MILRVSTIARSTFLESIRQPVFTILLVGGGLALVLNTNLAAYTLEDDTKLLVDLGLSTIFIVSLLLCAFTATNVLSREIENKTVLTIISKPVSRPAFILGKYVGVTASISVAFWVLTVIFLLTIRHRVREAAYENHDVPVLLLGIGGSLAAAVIAGLANYFYRWVFTSTFVGVGVVVMTAAWLASLVIARNGSWQHPLTDINPQLLLGLLMVLLAALVLSAVALLCSTRCGQVMTLVICTAAFLVGLVSEYFIGTLLSQSAGWYPLYVLIPSLQMFWPAEALTQGNVIPVSHVLMLAGYAVAMVAALLSFSVVSFQTRDIG